MSSHFVRPHFVFVGCCLLRKHKLLDLFHKSFRLFVHKLFSSTFSFVFFFVFLYFLFMSLLSCSSFVVFAFSLLFRTAAGWGYVGVRGTSLALCRTAREKLNTYVFKETLLQIGRNAPFAHRPETRPTTVIYCTESTHTFQFLFHFISFYKIRILIPSSSSLFIAFHFFFFLSLFYFSSSLLSPINWSPLIHWQYDFARVFYFKFIFLFSRFSRSFPTHWCAFVLLAFWCRSVRWRSQLTFRII